METKKNHNTITRRNFLGATATAAAAFTLVPSHAISGLGQPPAIY